MGTNFYFGKRQKYHIGKRSAAGMYCWNCNETLCKGGKTKVHFSEYEWYDKCPICGKKPEKESIEKSSAGRELGFNKETPNVKTGVKSASSFSWDIEPLSYYCAYNRYNSVYDEYGRKYTRYEFEQLLKECPIELTGSIGKDFS